MRLLFLLLTIWTTTAVGLAWAQQPRTNHPIWALSAAPPPRPQTLAILDLTAAANYPPFIQNMQKIFSEKGVEICKMKKMSEAMPSPRYGYIDIVASGTVKITLAMDRTNIYVLGYRDKFNGKDRAFFFNDEFNNARDLFPEATGKNRIKLAYSGQYWALEDRDKVPLGIKSFRTSITKIYGQQVNKNFNLLQKKFFTIALQMISEATRFKYIFDKIPTANDHESFTPDEKVMKLENGWDALSTAIYTKTEPVTKEPKPISGCKFKQGTTAIKLEDQWTFESVEEIAAVIGILKSKGSRSSTISDENDDDDGVVVVASL